MRLYTSLVTLAALVLPATQALNVAIVCTFGTRSDIAPIFEGLKDFAAIPGNNITYLAAPGLATGHASQFSYVESRVIPGLVLPEYMNNSAIADVVQTKKRVDNTKIFLDAINWIADIYEPNTRTLIEYFETHEKFDLVLCDAVEQACMDATKETGQKLAIYGPLGQYGVGSDWYVPDFLDPMPMEEWIASPWKRAKSYIDLIPFVVATLQARWKVQAAQARLGLTMDYIEPWEYPQKHLMLTHHVLGIEPSRMLPTNIEVFGPVVNMDNIPPMEPELQMALDNFQMDNVRVVFIAFGSVLTLKDSPELAEVMTRSIEQLVSDPMRKTAVIWASAYHDEKLVAPIQAKYPGRFLTPSWANQRRALMHDSVQVLISHAGYGSMTEALYNGKAQLMIPIVFDEFVNAHNAEEAGIALQMDKYTMTSEEMTSKVQRLLDAMADSSSKYARTVQRWKEICHLNNLRARTIVTNAVTMAATTGIDHLVPRDVTLSLFDRFAVFPVLVAYVAFWLTRKLLSRAPHMPSSSIKSL
ncbi:TPA: hypothetical protein N0F65_006769 [Lagenidium giganteum]|uniref:UDP-Glycosyltransferase/glycogen phosphorylase n=1 Tax=Lagenidium giganteum TaxID=4803 RepID=A0AAV2ZH62_9STRA|nr:TPA: hypothetical protein N0F65_006769 [Lagenidium giganteum]